MTGVQLIVGALELYEAGLTINCKHLTSLICQAIKSHIIKIAKQEQKK
jgi:hypothetical protein